jgi:YidC/Oxa1 family membrane protein insertase
MDNKLVFSIIASVITVSVLQFYMNKNTPAEQQIKHHGGSVAISESIDTSGQISHIPTTEELRKPLNLEIDFLEKKIPKKEEITVVETNFIKAIFSSFGGILSTLDFKKHRGKSKQPLRTVYDLGGYEDEQKRKQCFLLALENKTPYFYNLIHKKELDGNFEVTFQTQMDSWIIRKIYSIKQDSYVIQLKLEFEPVAGNKITSIKPRLSFSAPFIYELSDDSISTFVLDEKSNSIEKKESGKERGLAWYWGSSKVIFGAEDKYFAHSIIQDPDKFVRRAYFKKHADQSLSSILEGPEIVEKKELSLSFYFGPKKHNHLESADERLIDLLSFGWLSWICKLMLQLINSFFDLLGNYGFAIVLLTILLRLPIVPLSIYSRKKMEEYQKYQPTITKIRAKHKDPNIQRQELMRFHQEHNLSMATPMIGCLPLLMQFPILFSLYRVLGNYVDLYQAPFFGWVIDLSSKDPYYVLPVLMGVSMLWQQQLSPVGDDKQKVVMIFMSIVVTVMFASFPSGLVLYWLMNNLLTIGEDYLRKFIFS